MALNWSRQGLCNMYKQASVLNTDNVIEFIKTGRVEVRNIRDAQVFYVYGMTDKKPSVSFENNWGVGEFVLYINQLSVAGFNYAKTPGYKTMRKYKDLVSIMEACVIRCREQLSMHDNDNKIGVSGYRKNAFAEFIKKMCNKPR